MAREKKPSRGRKSKNSAPKEFEERLLEIRRVTRVTTGGRRMSFRATVLIGNMKGKIGLGVAKGPDVAVAVRKATREAYKMVTLVPIAANRSVPYALTIKNKACKIKLIPAAAGTGLKAGSSLRVVLELAGYENMLSKIVGSNNKLNVALTTIKALTTYKHSDHFTVKPVATPVEAEDETTEVGAETAKKKQATKKKPAVAKKPTPKAKKAEAKEDKPAAKEPKETQKKPATQEPAKDAPTETKE